MKQTVESQMVKGQMEMLILALLKNRGSMHGYRIRQTLTDQSQQIIQPSYGCLYPHLSKMEQRGWLQRRTELVGERRERIIYSITATGQTELNRRITKWTLFSRGIEQILQ